MKTLIERLEAALGDAHDPVKVALVAGDLRELIAAHKEATAKAEGMEEVVVLKMAERDVAEAKFKALHEAAGEFLAKTQEVHVCHRCEKIATKRVWIKLGLNWFSCDDHVGDCHAQDLPHAAPPPHPPRAP